MKCGEARGAMLQFDKFNPSTEFENVSLAGMLTNSFQYMIDHPQGTLKPTE
jgi:hypothetical protein